MLFLKLRQPDPKRPSASLLDARRPTAGLPGVRLTASLEATASSAIVVRAATALKASLALDPTLASDEIRLAAIIRDEFRKGARISSIPASLRDDI